MICLFICLEQKENVYPQSESDPAVKEEAPFLNFLNPVASIHVAMRERQARRKSLFASSGPYKRALSARRDLAIRFVIIVKFVCFQTYTTVLEK